MPAPRPTPLVCPVCRTRLRVQAALLGTEVSCPECASRLLIAADQQSARLLAVHPLETAPVPVETEPTETSSAAPFLSRRQLWLAAGVTLIVSGGLFISLIRSESDRGSASSDTEVAPANAESPEPEVPVAVAETTPMPVPDPVAPAPVVVPPAVIEPPVAVAVVAPVPPDPEVKPVAPPPVAELKPVDDLAARKVRLTRVTRQRIALFETSSKTPLRQLLREVNEIAAGLVVIDETVSASDLDRQVSIKQRDANIVELLEAMLQSSGLRVEVREDHISITKPDEGRGTTN